MEELNRHWTSRSIKAFVHRITSDFFGQLEIKMEQGPIERQELARRLEVTPGRVSQVLDSPGNSTVKTMVEYGHALGKKVAIIAYEDDDPNNDLGPVNAEVFTRCWEQAGKPRDLFSLPQQTQLSPIMPDAMDLPTQPRYARGVFGQGEKQALVLLLQVNTVKQDMPLPGKTAGQETYDRTH